MEGKSHKTSCFTSPDAAGKVTEIGKKELIAKFVLGHELIPLPIRDDHVVAITLESPIEGNTVND